MIKKQVNEKFWKTFFRVFLEALVIVIVILIFLWMNKIAFYAFSNEPSEKNKGTKYQIRVEDNESVRQIAKELESKGIVDERQSVVLRYYCSNYREYEIHPGTYQVSDQMGIDDLLNEFTGK